MGSMDYEERQRMELDIKKIEAEAELTKQRALMAQNPGALQLMSHQMNGVDNTTRARIEESRASMEWVPRVALTFMYLFTLWAYYGLAQGGSTNNTWTGWLVPVLLAVPLVMFALLRRK